MPAHGESPHSRVWKVALVGARRGSSYGNLTHADPRFEISAICDVNQDSLAAYQRAIGLPDARCFTDYGRLLGAGGFDAVIVCTPIPFHADQSVEAMDAGFHVMSEVTAANTVEGCARIVAAARRSGKTYMLAENTCHRPLFAEWRRLLESGRLGEPIYAEADYLHPIPQLLVNEQTGQQTWRAQRPAIHYCSHSLGPILMLTGDRIVRAMGIGAGTRILPEGGVGGIDIQLGVFETANGAIIKMTRTQVAPRHRPIHYYHIQGTKGFVETDRLGPEPGRPIQRGLLYIAAEMEHTRQVEWPEVDSTYPEYATMGGHGTSDYHTLLRFLDALDRGTKAEIDETRAWDMTMPGLIAAESALNGGAWMDVPEA